MKLKKFLLIISIFLIVIGISINTNIKYNNYLIEKKEKNSITNFIEHKSNDNLYDYIAILEIPSISLIKGINNNVTVDEGISILNYDSISDGYIILASHSGNCKVCYFNNLDKLNLNDLVYFYYNNIKYVYNITNVEIKKKRTFNIENSVDTLTLITCKRNSKDLQIIITCKLIRKEEY